MARYRFPKLAKKAERKFGIDNALLMSLIKHESGFDPNARSPAGAAGSTQFMPGTAQSYGVMFGDSPRAVKSQVFGAAKYLRDLKKQFGSNKLALAAYNAGPGNVEKYGGVPPFEETQAYVKNVLGARSDYAGAGQVPGSRPEKAPKVKVPTMTVPPGEDPRSRLFDTLQGLQEFTGQEQSPEIANTYELLSSVAQQRAMQEFNAQMAKEKGTFAGFGKMRPSKTKSPGKKGDPAYLSWSRRKIGTQEGTKKWAGSASFPWCSVFVSEALKRGGIDAPYFPYSGDWLNWGGGKKVSPKNVRPGDIVVFDWGDGGITDHVAIYSGNGKVIGGNQSDQVSEVPWDRGHTVGIIRPKKRR